MCDVEKFKSPAELASSKSEALSWNTPSFKNEKMIVTGMAKAKLMLK